MTDKRYWKNHYVIQTDANNIERNIKSTVFSSGGKNFELLYFEKDKYTPNILISQGSGGHPYIFAELGFLMHLHGYNVFIMPRHGGKTINELMMRHMDALNHISSEFNAKIGVFSEGLGGYASFYSALAGCPAKAMVFQNAPAILTEEQFHAAIFQGNETAARRRKRLLPLLKPLSKLFPWVMLPISIYLDFQELVDTKKENQEIEAPIVQSFRADPDFDRHYPLSAIMSLVQTPPPRHLSELHIPVLFIVPVRGFFPSYFKDLYSRISPVEKN